MITTLKVVDVLLIAVVIGSIDVAVKVWKGRRLEMSSTETKRLAEYNAQVRLVKCLNSVETFVEQAKATRRMNALKKELLALAEKRLAEHAPSELQKLFDRVRTPVLLGLIMVYYWNEPLVVLPQGFMLPVERLMSFPGFPLGAVSAVGWAGICRRVSAKILG
uniref:Guided entry of tail-anchored proteins 1 n=1 Tax=Hyaloperonospora arabidopsidis (strain Emoy2) TaxID=559515 RepID=M4B8F6_HYAAE